MKNRIAFLALVLLVSANTATAYVWGEDWSPAAIGSMKVAIDDEAKGGCWTNLGEAKTYAEDKLRNLGFTVTAGPADYDFMITINSRRVSDRCYGSIRIIIYSPAEHNGNVGFHEIGVSSLIFIGYKNANTLVLDQIKSITDDIAAKRNNGP
jgi:hypothetical protein